MFLKREEMKKGRKEGRKERKKERKKGRKEGRKEGRKKERKKEREGEREGRREEKAKKKIKRKKLEEVVCRVGQVPKTSGKARSQRPCEVACRMQKLELACLMCTFRLFSLLGLASRSSLGERRSCFGRKDGGG